MLWLVSGLDYWNQSFIENVYFCLIEIMLLCPFYYRFTNKYIKTHINSINHSYLFYFILKCTVKPILPNQLISHSVQNSHASFQGTSVSNVLPPTIIKTIINSLLNNSLTLISCIWKNYLDLTTLHFIKNSKKSSRKQKQLNRIIKPTIMNNSSRN